MRLTRLPIALLTIIALAGCSDAVLAPTEITLPPAFAMGGGAEVTPREVLVVPLDHTLSIECAGEDVRFTGDMVFWLHRVTTPSGVEVLHVTIPSSALETPILATGQTSGRVWRLERGTSVQTVVRKDGETTVVNVSRNETYVADDGSTLRLHHTLHITMRDGESVEVETEEWICR